MMCTLMGDSPGVLGLNDWADTTVPFVRLGILFVGGMPIRLPGGQSLSTGVNMCMVPQDSSGAAVNPIQSVATSAVDENSPVEVLVVQPRVRALMDVVSYSEGSDYNTMVHGKGSVDITDFTKHPNVLVEVNSKIKSTAAGRYQILFGTWQELHMKDFTPASQDLAAVKLFKRRKMLKPLFKGDFEQAIKHGNKEWASFPGSPYGQPTHTMPKLKAVFDQKLKSYEVQAPLVKK